MPPRRARAEDAPALADLRAVMLDAMHEGPRAAGDDAWRDATVTWFVTALADAARCAVFVVDDPGPVACAMAVTGEGAPVPGRADRRTGQVFNVATAPHARRRGHARACTAAALDWLAERGVARTSLTATPDALALYADLGFRARPWTLMRRDSAPGS